MKVGCFIVVLFLVCHCYALDSSLCQQTPQEKHCLIEYPVRDRWPHQVRYVYNWYTKTCFEIRWSNNCPPVPSTAVTNNFPSEAECQNECGGWA